MAFSRFAYLASTALVALAAPAMAQDTSAPAAEDDTITITGIRRSIADSIDTKRRADSITDVISAEDVGKFPDSNVADSLARLPGVTVDRQFGEGEQLSIAGTEPALNRVTIDGHSVASADWGRAAGVAGLYRCLSPARRAGFLFDQRPGHGDGTGGEPARRDLLPV